MARPKSSNSGSNVTDLAEARRKRALKAAIVNTGDEELSADAANTAHQPVSQAKRVSNRRFDKVKVDRIKQEIANGEYQIDYLRVAKRFIEHERFS